MDRKTRWRSIDGSLPPPNPDFIGCQQLTTEERQFIATHDSGYLVISGGMGKGKTTWRTELIHDELACGRQPVYRIIDYHPSGTGQASNIAACLYDRLRRKYVFLEPPDWERQDLSSEADVRTLLLYPRRA